MLQVLARGLHPHHLLLRRAQRRSVLQDPLRAAVHGEGELQPHDEEEPVPGYAAGHGSRRATAGTGATARRGRRGQLGGRDRHQYIYILTLKSAFAIFLFFFSTTSLFPPFIYLSVNSVCRPAGCKCTRCLRYV
ncbi:LIM domain-containing protein PLIM2b [Zea mays]|uniref:LIM domain-containing protein PLIM2b n=1 Tax=Zea mays TaxID=4577 RepID=A0A1D6JAW4_MAIZE|nr:LIM domain-containing protein PLIM2b [Zea mays]